MGITRHEIQASLGVLWLLDGALQAQPFMFTRGFATQIVAAAGRGQPAPVHAAAALSSSVIGGHPFAINLAFAGIQLALGVGLLLGLRLRPVARPVLLASAAWGLGVWVFGESLGGVLGGSGSLFNGAPGAALLYTVLALAALPPAVDRASGNRLLVPAEGRRLAPAVWLPYAWLAIWLGMAGLQALPGQDSGVSLQGQLTANLSALPAGLAGGVRSVAAWSGGHGHLLAGLLIAAEIVIAVAALAAGRSRTVAAAVGGLLALAVWVSAQAFGGIGTGMGTDPNSGPLLILLALAVAAVPGRLPLLRRRRLEAVRSQPAYPAGPGFGSLQTPASRPARGRTAA